MSKPKACTDAKQFVFVSYAHRDADRVFPEIERIARVVPVWYDEGIEAGSNWRLQIAARVDGATAFVVFMSEAALLSTEVREEITWALNKYTPVVVVFLEDIGPFVQRRKQMPNPTAADRKQLEAISGMVVVLNSKQALLKYELSEPDYDRKLKEAILKSFKDANQIARPGPGTARGRAATVGAGVAGGLGTGMAAADGGVGGGAARSRWLPAALGAVLVLGLAVGVVLGVRGGWFARGQAAPPGMILVPGGPFRRGCTEEFAERLVRKFRLGGDSKNVLLRQKAEEVFVPAFYLDRHAVTNAQYRQFLEATRYPPPSHFARSGAPFPPALENHPVVNVSFKDAMAYCQWAKRRLPSALEWEKAARGTDFRFYPWGDEFARERCNTVESGMNSTTPVDSHALGVGPYGHFNLTGNVFEWTSSDGLRGGKIIKGGSFKSSCEVYGLVCFESAAPLDLTDDDTGFRCAMDAEPHATSR